MNVVAGVDNNASVYIPTIGNLMIVWYVEPHLIIVSFVTSTVFLPIILPTLLSMTTGGKNIRV